MHRFIMKGSGGSWTSRKLKHTILIQLVKLPKNSHWTLSSTPTNLTTYSVHSGKHQQTLFLYPTLFSGSTHKFRCTWYVLLPSNCPNSDSLQSRHNWLIQNSRQSDKLSVLIISQQQSDIFSSIYYTSLYHRYTCSLTMDNAL